MKVLVTGAAGILGRPVVELLGENGCVVVPSGRISRESEWLAWDMTGPPPLERLEGVDCVINTAPLWLLPDHVRGLASAGVRRLICFSSTSVLTKHASPSGKERRLALALQNSESAVLSHAAESGIAATIFRPTMIYGFGRDGNVSSIARFIRKYRFFPVSGGARGQRQPVHANDLANAVAAVLMNRRTHGKSYIVSGGETLTYRAMVQRIFDALGQTRRIVDVPAFLYRAVLESAALLGADVSAAMVDRMNQDLSFDVSDAVRDFSFHAEKFLARPERDLLIH